MLASISNRTKTFVYVQRKADPERAAVLERRELAGLGFYPEERRDLPAGRTAASLIGYAGIDNEGLAGIELQYDCMRSPGRTVRRRSCVIRSERRSTSSNRSASNRARTSS